MKREAAKEQKVKEGRSDRLKEGKIVKSKEEKCNILLYLFLLKQSKTDTKY